MSAELILKFKKLQGELALERLRKPAGSESLWIAVGEVKALDRVIQELEAQRKAVEQEEDEFDDKRKPPKR